MNGRLRPSWPPRRETLRLLKNRFDNHTWRKVVDKSADTGLKGSVSLTSFTPNTTLNLDWHQFTTQVNFHRVTRLWINAIKLAQCAMDDQQPAVVGSGHNAVGIDDKVWCGQLWYEGVFTAKWNCFHLDWIR